LINILISWEANHALEISLWVECFTLTSSGIQCPVSMSFGDNFLALAPCSTLKVTLVINSDNLSVYIESLKTAKVIFISENEQTTRI